MSLDVMEIIYYSYVHSVIFYEVILIWVTVFLKHKKE
jgi:hypothetical protein